MGELLNNQPVSSTPWPLSPVQRQYWLLAKLYPESCAYKIPSMQRIRGDLNVPALRSAFEEHVRRHDVFRTAIEEQDGVPYQYLLPEVELPFHEHDLRSLSGDQQAKGLQRIKDEMIQSPFNFAHPPFFRVELCRTADREWVLMLLEHHLVIDLCTRGIMEEEIGELYEAFSTNRTSHLPNITHPYSTYTKWQLEWEKSAAAKEGVAAWKELLEGKIHPPAIPLDKPRGTQNTMRGGEAYFCFTDELHGRIKQFSYEKVLPERWAKASITSTLAAGYALLLARHSGQQDQTIGMAYGNRLEPGQLEFRGSAANTVPVPIRVTGQESFLELAQQAQAITKRVRALQQVSFQRLVEELNPERNQSYNPLFQVGMEIETPLSLSLDGLDIQPLPIVNGGAKTDLNLVFHHWEERLEGYLEYNIDLFDPKRAELMVQQFIGILEEGVAHPERATGDFAVISQEERALQLEEWGRGDRIEPPFFSLPAWVTKHAQERPDAPAIRFGKEQVGYVALHAQSRKVAIALLDAGVKKGDLVGLCCDRSPAMVVGLLGIQLAGAAYLPLDPEYPSERLSFMVEDSGARWILTRAAQAGHLPDSAANLLDLDDILRDGSVPSEGITLPAIRPDDRAYLIYTSGSTGKPKGVELLHGGLSALAYTQMEHFSTGQESHVLQFASLNFDASIWEILMAFAAGGTLCLGTRQQMMPGPDLVQLLRDQQITIATLPPSVLSALPSEELPDLETIIVAGEPCPARLVQQWAEGRSFFNAYGPTETTVCATIERCIANSGKPGIGRPVKGAVVRLLDERLHLVPAGAVGELCVGGILLAKGYLKRPDLTGERFIVDPFSDNPQARLYRTGDLARWRMDGTLELVGRRDNQVKIRGFRIELGEIESTLNDHPDVQQTVVVPHGPEGEAADRLVAYLISEGGRELRVGELKSYLAQRLPAHMLPSVYIPLDRFPLTPNDKVDRTALSHRPLEGQLWTTAGSDVTLNEGEKRVAAIWQEVLGLDRVGVTDNFFDVGGHSLSLMTLRSRLEAEFSHPLDAVTMFLYPTISGMAKYLTNGGDEGAKEGAPDRAEIRNQQTSQAQQRKLARLKHRTGTKS